MSKSFIPQNPVRSQDLPELARKELNYRAFFQSRRNCTKANLRTCREDIGPDSFARVLHGLATKGLVKGPMLRTMVYDAWRDQRILRTLLSLDDWAEMHALANQQAVKA